MRRLILPGLVGMMLAGCASGGPTDSDQQKLAKDFSPETVAKEYEKQGKHEEAAEVRRSMKKSDEGGQ